MHNVVKYLQDPDDFPDYVDLLGNIGNPDVDMMVGFGKGAKKCDHQLATIIHGNDN